MKKEFNEYLKEYSKRKTSYKKNNFLLITFALIIGLIPCIFIPHLFLFWIPATLYSFRAVSYTHLTLPTIDRV